MSIYKFTMLFEQSTNPGGTSGTQRLAGWSESLYQDLSTTVDFPFPKTCTKRAALLPATGRIIGQRLQQVFPAGKSITFGQTFPGNAANPSDIPQAALLCYGSTATGANVRRFTLRGVPDKYIVTGEYSPDAAFTGAVNNYFARLRLDGWGFAGRDLTTRPTALSSVSELGVVTVGAAMDVEVGDRIQIQRTLDSNLTGISVKVRVLEVTSSTSFKIGPWNFGTCFGGSALNITAKTIFPFSVIKVNRVVVRKVGRPFAGYRGRSSKRKK